ncbi:MAG: redox-regulated ATPase YchF [Elusimicrobia bacterium CG1_02_37_114]|nr:MAG: redox-regulated ATPase YchF [Elusimicrobia bacterium CG1_02_37_114]PIV53836.1 MAG: redox-regulated ATPase YchF [Elusimicrobia bacterium CG02_land_8_20_14_3_00_37_13]PIZ13618.1 MAG: redox-regulated ATPase YchF [Elusimicrobia bacterium CG_4_10_14_0_8_um_filter_37_32]
MEIGITGLPNVGKSTLFNALTSSHVPAENFPFTTIDPNVGIVTVPDERLKKLGEIIKPEKLTPATIKFVDIAGLVKGASHGEGLGNKFLSHIREVDALLHIVRLFKDEKVAMVLNEINPINEIQIVETELILSDLEQAEKTKEKQKTKDSSEILSGAIEVLNQNKILINSGINGDDIAEYNFLTAKPVLYVFNINESTDSKLADDTKKWLRDNKKSGGVSINIKLEQELTELQEDEKIKFRKELGLENQLENLIKESYRLLNLITFYTVVGKETRAWSIPGGTHAKKAAGKIHSDMEKGFICAEVYPFNDLIKYGSKLLHDSGLARTESKDYPVADGDVVKFKFK